MVCPDRPFTLYLMDHGSYDRFYLDWPRGETVTPGQIDGWLTILADACPGAPINVIVEACHSGSFIDLFQTVSKPGRVVIASTSAAALAWASAEGAIFSDALTAALGRDETLYAGFRVAADAARIAHGDQIAWLDDNGNGIPNEPADGAAAQRRGFTYPGTFCVPGKSCAEPWPPHIWQARGPDTVAQGQGVIQAHVLDDAAVHRVWAVIYPPSYQPPPPGDELGKEALPTLVLNDLGNGWYGATYTGFGEVGLYRVVVYAEDNDRLEARPVAVAVRTGWQIFLPTLLKEQ